MQLTHPLEISLPGVVSSQAEQDDAQLVKAGQHGDQNAFAFLVQKHQHLVFNMVLRMLQDYEEVSEITQEVFFAAWQGLHHSEARRALLPGSIASPTIAVCDSLNGASGRETCRRNRSLME